MKHTIACIVSLFLSITLTAQESLNNVTILKLVKAGIGEDTIVGMVNQQPGKYLLADADIAALKTAGVSEKIIAAMIVKGGASNAPLPSKAASVQPTSSGMASAIPGTNQPKTRVLVTDSQSWQISGGFAANSDTAAGYVAGGARPQTAEIMKTIGERCPALTVTNDRMKADYVLLLDHEEGKGYARRRNKVAVFGKDGDIVYSGSTRSLGNAVQDACAAIEQKRGK
jgi:hypothetical protein